MFDLSHVASIKKIEINGVTAELITADNPHIGIKAGLGPEIWLNNGDAYGAGGARVAEFPAWFWEEVGKLTVKARQSVGWDDKYQAYLKKKG